MSSRRARACDACHAIKIKCELGSTGGQPPCERCTRLKKECVITPPKRQKDRVAELEAKVEALTRLLEAQGLSSTSPDDDAAGSGTEETPGSLGEPSPSNSRKRRRDGNSRTTSDSDVTAPSVESFDGATAADLDKVVSIEVQALLLERYRNEMVPHLPIVPLGPQDTLEKLRKERPVLLQAIAFAVCPSVMSSEDQNKVALVFLGEDICAKVMKSRKTMELVQALQISTIWYWVPQHQRNIAAYDVVELICQAAMEIGVNGPSPSAGKSRMGCIISSFDAWRAWAVCYLLMSEVGFYLRRPNTLSWTQYLETCLAMLEYTPTSESSDRLLCQQIRGERLCDLVASTLRFFDDDVVVDVADPDTQQKMRMLEGKIQDWQAQVPTFLRTPAVLFWRTVATMYMHESILHTATNKHTFVVPFVAERLSVTDFPSPVITPEHITSAHALAAACHASIEMFCSMDTSSIKVSPGLTYTGRMLYAMYILIKLYIASTAVGNTYGMIIGPADLRVEHYLLKLIGVASRLKQVDTRAAPAIMLSSMARLYEWLTNYNISVFGTATVPVGPSSSVDALSIPQNPTDGFSLDNVTWDDLTSGASLDQLIAEIDPSNWRQHPATNGDFT